MTSAKRSRGWWGRRLALGTEDVSAAITLGLATVTMATFALQAWGAGAVRLIDIRRDRLSLCRLLRDVTLDAGRLSSVTLVAILGWHDLSSLTARGERVRRCACIVWGGRYQRYS